MAHREDKDDSRVSHPQPAPGFKAKQTMEDFVSKDDTDVPPPPECPASQNFLYIGWRLFARIDELFRFRAPAFTSTKAMRPSIHPDTTWECVQTHRRCDWCEEIIKRLEHELACSTASHQHDMYSMQGHTDMLEKELCKMIDEKLSQQKLFQEETDLQKSRFGAQIQHAHMEIHKLSELNEKLRGSLNASSSRNKVLARHIDSLEQENAKASSASGSYLESLATPQLLETAVQGVKDALGSVSKELISLMKLANRDITDQGRNLQPAVRFSRPSHAKFAIQSCICQRLFLGFEREDFGIQTGEAHFLSFDRRQAEYFSQYKKLSSVQASELMMDSATQTPDLKDFNHYCQKNYSDIVTESAEIALLGNEDLRSALKQGKHPECELYQTFFRLFKLVWALHRLAFSFEPHAHVIRVERGAKFDAVYMRSIVMDEECDETAAETSPAVAFMVLPGFRVSKCVVQSQVYLNLMDSNQVVDRA